MRMKIHFKGGPHDGTELSVSNGKPLPQSLWMPVWPEPDWVGPPYPQARYELTSPEDGLYEYDRTEEPEVN